MNAHQNILPAVAGEHPDDGPTQLAEQLQSVNIPGVLAAVGAMLLPVVLDRDLE